MKKKTLFVIVSAIFFFLGCDERPPPSGEQENVEVEDPGPQVKLDPRLVAIGLPVYPDATLVESLSKSEEGRSVVVLETDDDIEVIVDHYESSLRRVADVRRFSDRTEYVWSWEEKGGVHRRVHIGPVSALLSGDPFTKAYSITLVTN